jgi:hypothetical protein
VSILLIVLQQGPDLLLDLAGQAIQVSSPCVAASHALHHDDREALHDEHASAVMTLRTLDGERVVRVRHDRREIDPTAELGRWQSTL